MNNFEKNIIKMESKKNNEEKKTLLRNLFKEIFTSGNRNYISWEKVTRRKEDLDFFNKKNNTFLHPIFKQIGESQSYFLEKILSSKTGYPLIEGDGKKYSIVEENLKYLYLNEEKEKKTINDIFLDRVEENKEYLRKGNIITFFRKVTGMGTYALTRSEEAGKIAALRKLFEEKYGKLVNVDQVRTKENKLKYIISENNGPELDFGE